MPSDQRPRQGLGRALQVARERAFVEREDEKEVFTAALSGPSAVAVIWVHGPGGIGKSTLTRQWVQQAQAAGRSVIEVDGRFLAHSPQEFEHLAGAVLHEPGAVVVLDTFEQCQWLEGWLREQFLPRIAPGALVVLSGRARPDVEWSLDPGWSPALLVHELAPMTPEQSGALLAARGVSLQDRPGVAAFAGGNPLALSLAAAVTQRSPHPDRDWTPTAEVLATLMSRLIGEVPSARHRRALEMAAQAHSTTEELLRAVLPDEDCTVLFAWLRELPFMESSPQGLFPHDAARETLVADLRWRSPEGYEAIRDRLLSEHLRLVRQVPPAQMLQAMGRAFYLYRDRPQVRAIFSWSREAHEHEDEMSPEHLEKVLEMTRACQGEAAAELARYWYGRQPEAFHLFREARTGEIIAFSAHLVLPAPADPQDVRTDPVVAAAWEHNNATAPVRPGEHFGMTRFAIYPAAYEQPTPVLSLMHWRGLAGAHRAVDRAQGYLVYQDAVAWAERLRRTMTDTGRRVLVGERTFSLFFSDWRVTPFEEWFKIGVSEAVPDMRPRTAGPDLDPGLAPDPDPVTTAPMTRADFDECVRLALLTWHHPEGFASNALLRRSFVSGPDGTPVERLRAMVSQAVEAMPADLAGVKAHAALVATYFSGAPTQEAAARRLGLPFGTYRRHLRAAVARVADVLWEAELATR
jgi:hypothetical protein